MGISFFSFLMALLWSSAALLPLCILHRNRSFVQYFGIAGAAAVYGIWGLRLLLPVEFPHIVYIVGLRGLFADVYEYLSIDTVYVLGMHTKRIYIFGAIWAASILIVLIRWAVKYRSAVRRYTAGKVEAEAQVQEIMDQVKRIYPGKVKVTVWKSSKVESPMGMGVFHKVILLPEHIRKEENLYYILLHEYTHFIKRDTLIKFLVHILCCIFWWNPIVRLLQSELDRLLEIRCDLTVTRKMNGEEKSAYLETIVEAVKSTGKGQKEGTEKDLVWLFGKKKKQDILERFQIVMDQREKSRKSKAVCGMCILALCLLMGSTYLVQIQAEYSAPKLSEGYEMTPENTYLVDNGDGTYMCVDASGKTEDDLLDEQWLIEDMIAQGFEVKRRSK